jgi:hypothetical protein
LIVLDEAARIDDELIAAIRPMQATVKGGGRLVELSTPKGRRGHFFERWHSEDPGWLKIKVTADQCPRISRQFLEEELRELGPLMYSQEYMCEFVDDAEALFDSELIEAAFADDVVPLFAA